jgi:DNA-directed RNA polymerase subunit RPC12/RpoP
MSTCPLCWLDEPVADADGSVRPRYVYRCSRCGACYACGHALDEGKREWRCRDGTVRRGVDKGAPVTGPPSVNQVTADARSGKLQAERQAQRARVRAFLAGRALPPSRLDPRWRDLVQEAIVAGLYPPAPVSRVGDLVIRLQRVLLS